MNQELPDVQGGLRKGRGTRYPIASIRWNIKKAREFQEKKKKKKTSISSVLTKPKPLCGSHQTVENSLKRRGYQTSLPVS